MPGMAESRKSVGIFTPDATDVPSIAWASFLLAVNSLPKNWLKDRRKRVLQFDDILH
jgi:hypothetical protein